MADCGIYALRNTHSGRFYVGQSVDIARRWIKHKGDAARLSKKTKLLDAIRSYGPDAFEILVLELCARSELNAREVFWIQEKDALHSGYNHLSGGGQGHRELSPETVERYRSAQLGKRLPAETRAKISASLLGRKLSDDACRNISNGLRGRVLSDEHRARISQSKSSPSAEARKNLAAAQLGKSASLESRAKQSLARAGVKKSPEHRAKIAAAMMGNRNRANIMETI